jgi:two-component system cell cycle sensor histidine kinase/response regulator CckA
LFLHKDGRHVLARIATTPLYDKDGIFSGALGILSDITRRKEAEDALRVKDMLDVIAKSSGLGMSLINPDYTIAWHNDLQAEWFGTLEKTKGRNCFEVYDGRDAICPGCPSRMTFEKGDVVATERSGITTSAGVDRILSVTTSPIRDISGNVIQAVEIVQDVTERKHAEEALRHSQKLESIGTLAGGIAHDFNNILNAVLGQSSLALAKLPKESPAGNNITKAISAAERAADLTRQLLAYSGKGRFSTGEINLNLLVNENINLLEVSVPKTTQLRLELDSSSPHILGDVGQIQQVIMNIIINAGEAMGLNPGSINVRTGCMTLMPDDTEYWKYTATPLAPGKYAVLQIRDNGCGMTKETLNRLFDPFYTTKFSGRGLGLAAVLGIIRGHNGGVCIKSEEGQGTQFEVVFPLVASSATEAEVSQHATVVEGRGKAVLLIDDDAPVLELLSEIFTGAGFTVLTASNPLEGIELYRRHQEQISVVILDYSMPGMDGKAAFEELVKINSEVNVLLCSGYTEEETAAAFGTFRPADFLQKPYQPAKLLERVARMLSK